MRIKAGAILSLCLLAGLPLLAQRDRSRADEWPQTALLPDLPTTNILKPTRLEVGALFGNIVCAADSSMYFRRLLALGPVESALRLPVTRLAADGTFNTIPLGKIPELEGEINVFAFNVDRDGSLYTVVQAQGDADRQYLIAFSPKGEFLWKSTLSVSLRPSFLLPVPNQHFLISGMTPPKKGEAPSPVTGLFYRDGGLVKSLTLPLDAAATIEMEPGRMVNFAIQRGSAKLGPDDLVYLFKAEPHPKVQVMDTSGTTLRILELAPPVEKDEPFDFFVDRHSVVVAYQQQLPERNGKRAVRMVFAVYDATTGEPIIAYEQKTRGIVACIEDGSITYLIPTPDQHFAIARAVLP